MEIITFPSQVIHVLILLNEYNQGLGQIPKGSIFHCQLSVVKVGSLMSHTAWIMTGREMYLQ
jgi:hypothetical protein